MKLPTIAPARLDPRPVNLRGLPRKYMHPGELEVLTALVAGVTPRAVAEFGVNEGRTAAVLLENVPGIERYLGVDVLPGYVPPCEVQAKEVPSRPGRWARSDPRFEMLLHPRGTLDLSCADPALVGRFDAVFIDGDHSRGGVEHDTALARAMLRPGGVIVWHDYHDLGTVDVRDVLDDMRAEGAPIFHVEGTWLAFERV